MAAASLELPKSYDANQTENKWYPCWLNAGLFTPNASDVLSHKKRPYVIVMPPPNVTGVLHNGHALFVTLQDILIRFHRMKQESVLWIPGTDHAGIATQTVVERELKRSEGLTKQDLGRDAFVKRIWEFKDKNGGKIIEQMQMMGASADWSRCRFTLDEGCSNAVREAFVRLWNDGLIYRGERLVSWDPLSQTALSDEEVDHVTRSGTLWKFAYPILDEGEEIVVATTRPETMLGDVAVAVHPKDDRYSRWVGKKLRHPFFDDRTITVIADDYVDPEFGTGAVKITPAHDPNDFAMGQRHNLPRVNIFTLSGKINENGGSFKGLDRFEARQKVIAALTEIGLFRGEEAIEHAVSVSQRSGVDIEPLLSRQYFVRTETLAKNADAVIQSGETQILPGSWKKTWDHFMANMRDWCISRQLWWGHQIPVYYDVLKMRQVIEQAQKEQSHTLACHEALLAKKSINEVLRLALTELSDDDVRSFSKASLEDLAKQDPERYVQEEDVLDTWFSSGLWPFSTLGWPNKTDDLQAYYPSAVLETGFDILFFWVARMVMFGVHFMGRAPFSDVYLHAMVRDAHGKKMSKSLGNAIDPIDVIQGISLEELLAKTKTYPVPEKMLPKVLEGIKKDYPEGIPASGADGLRLSLAMLAGVGRDVKLAIGRVAGYRAFINKIWNASRFALMRVGDAPVLSLEQARPFLALEDRWILSQLSHLAHSTNQHLEAYRFTEAAEGIYKFFWDEFCDWYIELAKTRLEESSEQNAKQAAKSVIVEVLDQSMRLLHPICPFVTEEIWQNLPTAKLWKEKGFGYCAIAPYPQGDACWRDMEAEKDIGVLKEIVVALRNAKQESNLPAQKRVPALVAMDSSDGLEKVKIYGSAIERMATLESLEIGLKGQIEIPRLSAVNTGASFEAAVPLKGLLDVSSERVRLSKEYEKITRELDGIVKRLGNEGFVSKAPPEVIEENRRNQAELSSKKAKIAAFIERLLEGK